MPEDTNVCNVENPRWPGWYCGLPDGHPDRHRSIGRPGAPTPWGKDELAMYRRFAAEVYAEDSGLAIWSDSEFADVTELAMSDNAARLDDAR